VPNILTLTALNPDQLLNTGAYGAGAVIQVQSGALRAGPFTDETPTVPIVSGTTSYTFYDTDGTTATWYRTRYENAAGTTVSEWSTAFQPHVSLVSLAAAQARAGESVTQEMIDGVESWLVTQIGPLTGELTETFYLSERRNLTTIDGLWLSRRTDVVELTNDGDALVVDTDYRLINGLLVSHVSTGAAWGDTIVATYTPTDTDMVIEAIYDLLTVRSLPTNLQSVRIGAYSETYGTGGSLNPVVTGILGRVKPSIRLGRYASPFRYRAHREDRTLIEAVE
jgi:hypothetical protein